MKAEKPLTKKEITETFRKLATDKDRSDQDNISEWMKKSDFVKLNQEDVWIISDSTSSFANFNQTNYGKLERHTQ